jgi:hypothetical protein
VAPAEPAETLHDFSWISRRVQVTPQQLLDGEADGRYVNIKKNFKNILVTASHRNQRTAVGDEIKREKDAAEGVEMEGAQSAGSTPHARIASAALADGVLEVEELEADGRCASANTD